jgi:hypothetical protein
MSQALCRKASDRSMVHRASQAKAVEVCDVPEEVASTTVSSPFEDKGQPNAVDGNERSAQRDRRRADHE